MVTRSVLAIVAGVVAPACHLLFPIPGDVDIEDAATADADRDAATCGTAGECPDHAPYCEPTTSTCQPCGVNDHCPGGACLQDGTCADPGEVLYASPGGDSTTCEMTDPCPVETALSMVAPERRIVALAPGTYVGSATLSVASDTIVVGPGPTEAELRYPGNVVVFIAGGASLSLGNLAVAGSTSDGIQCMAGSLTLDRVLVRDNDGSGIAANACDVTITRSQIIDNGSRGVMTGASLVVERTLVMGNRAGGLEAGTIVMGNSIVVRNGPDGAFGGVRIESGGTIDHSTIADNSGLIIDQGGVACGAGTFIQSSILHGNGAADADCAYSYVVSDVGLPGDSNTVLADPGFVARDTAPYDYHLAAGSECRERADPISDEARDFDSEPRPIPAATTSDAGADEIP